MEPFADKPAAAAEERATANQWRLRVGVVGPQDMMDQLMKIDQKEDRLNQYQAWSLKKQCSVLVS